MILWSVLFMPTYICNEQLISNIRFSHYYLNVFGFQLIFLSYRISSAPNQNSMFNENYFTPSSYSYMHTPIVHTLWKKKVSIRFTLTSRMFILAHNIIAILIFYCGSAQIVLKNKNFLFKNVYQTKIMFTL